MAVEFSLQRCSVVVCPASLLRYTLQRNYDTIYNVIEMYNNVKKRCAPYRVIGMGHIVFIMYSLSRILFVYSFSCFCKAIESLFYKVVRT
jgi:hypothetical protein